MNRPFSSITNWGWKHRDNHWTSPPHSPHTPHDDNSRSSAASPLERIDIREISPQTQSKYPSRRIPLLEAPRAHRLPLAHFTSSTQASVKQQLAHRIQRRRSGHLRASETDPMVRLRNPRVFPLLSSSPVFLYSVTRCAPESGQVIGGSRWESQHRRASGVLREWVVEAVGWGVGVVGRHAEVSPAFSASTFNPCPARPPAVGGRRAFEVEQRNIRTGGGVCAPAQRERGESKRENEKERVIENAQKQERKILPEPPPTAAVDGGQVTTRCSRVSLSPQKATSSPASGP
ncbi:unnamed protein product, partial [Pleuronectes platessa]